MVLASTTSILGMSRKRVGELLRPQCVISRYPVGPDPVTSAVRVNIASVLVPQNFYPLDDDQIHIPQSLPWFTSLMVSSTVSMIIELPFTSQWRSMPSTVIATFPVSRTGIITARYV